MYLIANVLAVYSLLFLFDIAFPSSTSSSELHSLTTTIKVNKNKSQIRGGFDVAILVMHKPVVRENRPTVLPGSQYQGKAGSGHVF